MIAAGDVFVLISNEGNDITADMVVSIMNDQVYYLRATHSKTNEMFSYVKLSKVQSRSNLNQDILWQSRYGWIKI